MRSCLAASVFASILASASTSSAQERPPPSAATAEPDAPRVRVIPVPLGPRVLDPEGGTPLGYHPGTRIRTGLVIAGSVLFGTLWVPSAVAGSFVSEPVAFAPVVGPFVVAAQAAGTPGVNGALVFALVLDGVAQAGGLAMLIAGLAAREPVLLRADVKEAKAWWVPLPLSFGNRSAGLGFRGTL
jgi:hypothetical protein